MHYKPCGLRPDMASLISVRVSVIPVLFLEHSPTAFKIVYLSSFEDPCQKTAKLGRYEQFWRTPCKKKNHCKCTSSLYYILSYPSYCSSTND